MLDIDVGGTKIRTSMNTVQQLPMLEALLRYDAAGTMKATRTEDGLIFIDRNPMLFMKVLDGLRAEGKIFAESASEASALLEELAFFGARASCAALSAWESSVMEQVVVTFHAATENDFFLVYVEAPQEVLTEILPVMGRGGRVVDNSHGRRLVCLSGTRINPTIYDPWVSTKQTTVSAMRVSALLGDSGFVLASRSDSFPFEMMVNTMVFARKKLVCEHPFIINIEDFEDLFQIGINVLTHSLGHADLNGAKGTIVGYQNDSVVVKLQESVGEKAFKRKNLMLSNVTSDPFQTGVNMMVDSLATDDLNSSEGRVLRHQGNRVLNSEESTGKKALERKNLRLNLAHSDDLAAAASCDDGVHVMHHGSSGNSSTTPLVSDGHPLEKENHLDVSDVSTTLLVDNQKADAVEPDLQAAIQQSEHEALQKEQADIAQAIFESVRVGSCGTLLRLTHHDQEIRETLMTTNILGTCRSRVTEVGCELSPEWGNGALFLLPFRERSKFQELQLQGIRLEDLKPYNIVALHDDEDLIVKALAQVPRRRRPRCKHEGSGSLCKPGGSGSVGSPSIACASSETIPETGTWSDSAQEVLADIKIVTERTFITAFTAKEEHAAGASCHSAPL